MANRLPTRSFINKGSLKNSKPVKTMDPADRYRIDLLKKAILKKALRKAVKAPVDAAAGSMKDYGRTLKGFRNYTGK